MKEQCLSCRTIWPRTACIVRLDPAPQLPASLWGQNSPMAGVVQDMLRAAQNLAKNNPPEHRRCKNSFHERAIARPVRCLSVEARELKRSPETKAQNDNLFGPLPPHPPIQPVLVALKSFFAVWRCHCTVFLITDRITTRETSLLSRARDCGIDWRVVNCRWNT